MNINRLVGFAYLNICLMMIVVIIMGIVIIMQKIGINTID